jgi:hypothetical protein
MLSNILNNIKFIIHNLKLFKKQKNTNSAILVEIYNHNPTIISYSYFANILAKKFNSKIFAYNPNFLTTKTLIKKIFLINNDYLFYSFGTCKIITPYKKIFKKKKIDTLYNKLIKKIKTKKDLLDLRIENIPIGDLVYDEYLRRFDKPTIDIKSNEFKSHLKESIELYDYWKNLIIDKNIKAIIHSHTCYNIGLPARIGIFLNCDVYTVSMIYAYKLSKNNLLRSSGFEDYPKVFNHIKKKINKNVHLLAKKEIAKKLKGEVDIMQLFNQKQDFVSFNKKKYSFAKNYNKKIKILVASPCFTDAVHSYGENIFDDFFDWMNFIGKISLKTNYEWLIKLHPAHYDLNEKKMLYFINKYKKFKLISKYTTHNQILSKNISAVLTVYGSIAHEYPLFNVPVINSSTNNPHKAYSFSYNPQSKDELKKLLLNIHRLKIKNLKKIKKEIYEYYFTRLMSEYYFPNSIDIMKKLNNRSASPEFYNEWLKKFTQKTHNKIIEDCTNFIESRKFRMLSDNTSKNSRIIL